MHLQEILQFPSIYDKLRQSSLPVTLSYRLYRATQRVEEITKFFRDECEKVKEEFGEHNEDGSIKYDENGQLVVSHERIVECNQKVDELLNMEISDFDFSITLDQIPATLEFTQDEIALLAPFIKD